MLPKPLRNDRVKSIRQAAALALERMAAHTEEVAEAIVGAEMIPIVISFMKGVNLNIKLIIETL